MLSWIKKLFDKQKIIVLVGVPGSGKSTYAKQLKKQGYVIISQDTLGNREKCLLETRKALSDGKSVVIDRTNVNRKQRKFFIDISRTYGVPCHCEVFQTPITVCLDRVKTRVNHETMPEDMSDEQKQEIVQFFTAQYQAPTYNEGFHTIRYLDRHVSG